MRYNLRTNHFELDVPDDTNLVGDYLATAPYEVPLGEVGLLIDSIEEARNIRQASLGQTYNLVGAAQSAREHKRRIEIVQLDRMAGLAARVAILTGVDSFLQQITIENEQS